MRLTIIPVDQAVYVDGECRIPLDLSGCGVPSNVHALQWYDTRGWIEFNDDGNPFTPVLPNEDIYSLPDWADACVQVWTAWQPPVEPVVVDHNKQQPISSGTQTL